MHAELVSNLKSAQACLQPQREVVTLCGNHCSLRRSVIHLRTQLQPLLLKRTLLRGFAWASHELRTGFVKALCTR